IRTDDSYSKLASSNSKISLHGIEIPSSLFPEQWRMKNNQVKINWPFPLIIVIDVCGNRDLDLNSPRTEIIISEKWTDFEEQLALIVCQHIKDSVEIEYWNNLFEIFNRSNSSENFKRALNELK
ncbi:MAG: metal-dependent phosphohydrolase, partial [Bacteroidetes bacterium]